MIPGKFRSVCIIGADGAGKTTVGTAISEKLEYRGRSYQYWWCGWKEFRSLPFRVVRRLVRMVSSGDAEESDSAMNRMQERPTRPQRFLGLCYFPLVFIDHFLTTVPRATKYALQDRPVIYDRYYYGLVIGFAAYYSFPKRIVRILLGLARFYPTPDVVIYLEIDPETGFERKDDVPSPGYIRQRCEQYTILRSHENVVTVDARKPPETVEAEVLDILGAENE